MSVTVCLFANTIGYPKGGGHLWVYLNWALGLRTLGCRVIWLEGVSRRTPLETVQTRMAALKNHLAPYRLAECLALCYWSGDPLPPGMADDCLSLDAAAEADLLLNQQYNLPAGIVGRFPRSALLDIDPGLLQLWIRAGQARLARHDVYFTIGENVGRRSPRRLESGVSWQYTPPCVALEWWPVCPAAENAPLTTVTHWYADEWALADDGQFYSNDKRTGFLPYLNLPRCTSQPLELALCLEGDGVERAALEAQGWRVRESWEVSSTPWDYQRYIQQSRGEFSCAKPSCVRMQNAWISDRTLCYLASGKPAIVQHTGPSRFLPDAAGLFRFQNLAEAARCVETMARDYDEHCRLGRGLAEQFFDARKVAAAVLERALG